VPFPLRSRSPPPIWPSSFLFAPPSTSSRSGGISLFFPHPLPFFPKFFSPTFFPLGLSPHIPQLVSFFFFSPLRYAHLLLTRVTPLSYVPHVKIFSPPFAGRVSPLPPCRSTPDFVFARPDASRFLPPGGLTKFRRFWWPEFFLLHFQAPPPIFSPWCYLLKRVSLSPLNCPLCVLFFNRPLTSPPRKPLARSPGFFFFFSSVPPAPFPTWGN